MMDLADLAVMAEAAQAGSLAAAGRRLGITPMAASRRWPRWRPSSACA
jgi:DNA-binding transcriptional LysR family regulator